MWMGFLTVLVLFWSLPSFTAAQESDERVREAARLYDSREYARALEIIGPHLEKHPEDRQAVQLGALSNYFLGRLPEAIPLLEKSLQWYPEHVNYLNILGMCYVQTSAVEKSRAHFARMFGVEPSSGRACVINAQMYLRQSIWNRAEEEATRGLKADARIPQAHLILAEAAMGRNEPEKAVQEYKAEIELNPLLWAAHFRLAEALERLGRTAEAVAPLQKAIWLNPGYAGPYLLLGKIYRTQGAHSQSVQMLEQAVKLDPGNAGAHYMLAQTYQGLGRTGDAEREFKLAEQLQKSR